LRKIDLMCFSTARLVRTRASAIAALLLPFGHPGEDHALAGGQHGQRRALDAQPGGNELLEDPASSPGDDASIAAASCARS
jgi:hypothetical protein